MTVRRAVGFTALLLGGASVAAAQDRWIAPKCDVKPGHFMVNSGLLYLRSATNTQHQAQRDKDLRDAHRSLTQAITQNGQDKNGAAWYYLARYYGLSDQLVGADTAFSRAQALVPACKDDIAGWRKILWTPVFNQGVQAFNAAKSDSAMHYFQLAAAIYPEPVGLAAVAGLFANANQVDSALKYYARAAAVAGADTQYAKERREAMYNRAVMLYQSQRWAEAAVEFRSYLASYPTDLHAIAALASAYDRGSSPDSALVLYRQIVARADSADPATLISVAGSIFNAAFAQRDTTRANPLYRTAARALEAALARAPRAQAGLLNLANTYYVLGDTAKLLPVVQRWVALDPMNRSALRLAAAAFQIRRVPDSAYRYLALADSILAVDVAVQTFQAQEIGATLTFNATNYREMADSARAVADCRAQARGATVAEIRTRCQWSAIEARLREALASEPVELEFEFLDQQGAVVVKERVSIPTLAAGSSHSATVRAAGPGITAWRYKKVAG